MLKVAKFGGSSMADAGQYQKIRDIIRADPSRRVVVVSAAGKRSAGDNKITDLLYLCYAHLQYGVSCDGIYQMIRERYGDIHRELGLRVDLEGVLDRLRSQMEQGISRDELVSRGEYLSALLMADYLGFTFVDAAQWLFFHYDGTIDQEKSYAALRALARDKCVVIPGFYGLMPDGKLRTLTRGGSDITGALAAAALEQGISAQETYECTGSIEVGGHVYRCAYGRGHGTVDMKTALEQSCNCYFVQLGLRLGAQTVYDITKSAGFGQSQQVAGGLRAASGNLPDAAQLEDLGQLASISFGQGALTATPVQVAAMMNLFANGGRYVEPVFVEGIVDEYTQSVTESLYRPVQRQVMDKDVAEVIRQMLVGVVEEGLGRKAAPRAGGAGGKTGTAQTGRYHED